MMKKRCLDTLGRTAALLCAAALVLVLSGCPDVNGGSSSESSDATLKSLTVSEGTLDPAFDAETTAYTVVVGYAVESITVTGEAASGDATISANNGQAQPLPAAGTQITLTVTAEDGTTRDYTVTVIRSGTVVNALSLDGLVRAPVRAAAPDTTAIDAAQYTGTISWRNNDGTPFTDPAFTVGVVYQAVVTLQPKTGYTFTGIGANSFTYTGAAVTNPADSGTVTMVFPPTASLGPVSDLSGTPGIGSVSLIWINPDDALLDHVEITFTPTVGGITQPITVPKDRAAETIGGLPGDAEYTFTVVTVDTAGNRGPDSAVTLDLASTGLAWTAATQTIFPNPSQFPYALAWNGTNKFVTGGATDGKMAYSADGITWTQVTDSTFGNQYIRGIAWGNGKFVAVGTGGRIAYSANGETWTAVPVGTADGTTTTFGSNHVMAVAWNGVKFVAVGGNGTMAYSANGITWTAIPAGATVFGSTTIISGITWGNNRFVAVGQNGKMAYSADGETWAAIPGGTAAGASTFATNATINGITWGGGKFVAVGLMGQIAYSPDGITWTAVPVGTEDGTTTTFGTSNHINGITWGAGKFVAVGGAGKTAYSPDGIAWTAVAGPITYPLQCVVYGNKIFVTGGLGALGYSNLQE